MLTKAPRRGHKPVEPAPPDFQPVAGVGTRGWGWGGGWGGGWCGGGVRGRGRGFERHIPGAARLLVE